MHFVKSQSMVVTRVLCVVYGVSIVVAYSLITIIEVAQSVRGDYGRHLTDVFGLMAGISALLSVALSLIIKRRKSSFSRRWIWFAVGALFLVLWLPKL
jgi:hypothetical protein